MMGFGVAGLLIASAAGYWVVTQAEHQKGGARKLGIYLGAAIIVVKPERTPLMTRISLNFVPGFGGSRFAASRKRSACSGDKGCPSMTVSNMP